MEDCCAVCAEPLEWIAYGPCGHREVCSTCTARLRVVLDDKRCCICKQESSAVYVTKALGDYTKVVSDFTTLQGDTRGLWFESDIGAYFDDEDEYKRIKAMCRLQCKLCENAGASDSPPPTGAVRKGFVFRNLELLRRHIFGTHRLAMCSLCLEGRKVFIQDQKLYTKAQLDRHARGESKVDGTEEERGGFTGHPMCVFCNRRFYGDNELYHHMSTEHFTCHLCQRSRPGQFDYYENYDDLESHFRNEHSLCEDPECLAKKFIVFVSEGELKIHTAKEHGGSLTRAQRHAALKIPVSYQFRRSGGTSGDRRGGGSYHRGSRGNDLNAELLSADVPASEDANAAATSTFASGTMENFPALAQSDSSALGGATENPRWVSGLHGGGSQSNLSECAFPPLPGATPHHARQQQNQRPLSSLFTAKRGKVKVLNAAGRRQQQAGSSSQVPPPESRANATATVFRASDYPELHGGRAGHSISAAGHTARGPPLGGPNAASSSSFASAAGTASEPASSSSSSAGNTRHADAGRIGELSMDEIRAATKVLQEQIRAHLKGDEDRFATFKEIHAEFRKGDVSAESYYERVSTLGLSEILPELARLCPDKVKQRELLEVMKRSAADKINRNVSNGYREKGLGKEERRIHKPHEEEVVEVLSTDGYRSLRKPSSSSTRPSESLAASLSASGGGWACEVCTLVNPVNSFQCTACGTGRGDEPGPKNDEASGGKQQKKKKPGKVSRFLRNRLGDIEDEAAVAAQSSAAAAAGVSSAAGGSLAGGASSSEGMIRGAWRNNGGQRLVAMTTTTTPPSSAWNKTG